MSKGPALSVVVALISGEVSCLRRCLTALTRQREAVDCEILVPFDPPVEAVAQLAPEFPGVRFIPVEGADWVAARAGASREHHDTLRTVGIRAASAPVVALTEDHAHVAPDWCSAMLSELSRVPQAGAIGGAVECDSGRALNWAVYFCDFGRYQNPVPEGPARFVSDSNVAYHRAALDVVGDAWAEDYHETAVHGALVAAGRELLLTPRVVVWQARPDLVLRTALRERYVWARSYAGVRVRGRTLLGRLPFALGTPLLPFILTLRLARTAAVRGHAGRFIRVSPLVLLLNLVWSVGECTGYLTGQPQALGNTVDVPIHGQQ